MTSTRMPAFSEALDRKAARLREILTECGPSLVAFSGGVDSALLLSAAREVLGADASAVIAVSASLPRSELDEARRVAVEIGVPLHEVSTREGDDPRYRRNREDRCFFCKDELFRAMEAISGVRVGKTLVYGAIADDQGDYRPGMDAAREHRVRAPLLEAGLGKVEVRELARRRGLSVWDKPAKACLASRIPHGTPVTPERLGRVERAEEVLRAEGLRQYRVRDHGAIARLELDADGLALVADPAVRERIARAIQAVGFDFVTVDLLGYRTGSLNPRGAQPSRPEAEGSGPEARAER